MGATQLRTGHSAGCRGVNGARELFTATASPAAGVVRVNVTPDDETVCMAGAVAQLAVLQAKYDPGGLFRFNQSVRPRP
jgi:hypothetical protein